jgi:hypothetical protein
MSLENLISLVSFLLGTISALPTKLLIPFLIGAVLPTKFPRGKTRWIRVSECPFSRGFVYKLITDGILFSVALKLPGSKRNIRLVDANSLDKYLLKLGREQKKFVA